MIFRQHLFKFLFYLESKNNYYLICVILLDIQNQLRKHNLLNCFFVYILKSCYNFIYNSKSLMSMYLNPVVGINLKIKWQYRLFASKSVVCFDYCFQSEDFKYLSLAWLYLLEMYDVPHWIPFSKKRYMP